MMSLDEMYKTFPDNKACLIYIFKKNYSNAKCGYCKRVNAYTYNKGNKNFVCTCGQSAIYPRKGTLFDYSRTDLTKWFLTIYLLTHAKHWITSQEIADQTGGSYITTRSLRKKITKLMMDYMGKTITKDDKKRMLTIINARENVTISKTMENQYVAELLFRERYRDDDAFVKLLELAIKPNKSRKKA